MATPVDERPDVVFATMPTVEMAAAAARFGEASNTPVIIDVRDLHPDIYLALVPASARPIARVALFPLYRDLRTALRKASGIVAIAPSFLDWALGHAGRARTAHDEIFPLAYPEIGAEETQVEAAAQKLRDQGVSSAKRIVWYVGTFNRWIDLAPAIEAARLLSHQGRDDFQFVFSGSGDFGGRWRELAKGLPNVVFTGWVDVPAIIHMKRIAWAGLAPYRDGFLTVGNKLFEYMAGGLPILLSIGGDAAAIIERHDAGLTYDNDALQLVDAIDRMRGDGTRDRMAAHSLAAFRDHYSAAKVYPGMADHLLSFAGTRAAR